MDGPPADGIYRVEADPDGEVWICTPDYRRIAKFRRRLIACARGLLSARFVGGDNRAIIRRGGPGRAAWLEPDWKPARMKTDVRALVVFTHSCGRAGP